ncbi:MAG TPA: minor capsid protein [Chroococcidiopsis sp.]
MRDSVFDRLLTFADDVPNADDRPMMPIRDILKAQERIVNQAVKESDRLLETAVDDLMRIADRALANRDIEAIGGLTWNLGVTFQTPIYRTWEGGWGVGGEHAKTEMVNSVPVRQRREAEQFATPSEILQLIYRLLTLQPITLTQSPAITAVERRAIRLSGDYSDDTLRELQRHLVSAIAPLPGADSPISRPELLSRIENTLQVASRRAEAIARTELTNAYNAGRIRTMSQTPLCTHVRFLAIGDTRTTDICTSRNGMVIPLSDQAAVQANTPALHVNCRSTCSPLLPDINARHAEMVADPSRDYLRRSLAPLPSGWVA